ncbi:mitochondrial protein C2orf69 homolog [Branchiostoma lanceolatum]|uniref:mitochondrial protein C2orf69 homolog n=1 Tax=Branchiostoma lanceolatum TaxID=7740 RepID=UPI0034570A3F
MCTFWSGLRKSYVLLVILTFPVSCRRCMFPHWAVTVLVALRSLTFHRRWGGTMAERAMSSSSLPPTSASLPCRRLVVDQGFAHSKNEVIFCGSREAQDHVVFFPGDVQDYVENMEAHRDNKNWKQWNLEAVAELLSQRFPHSFIWVVKPSNMYLKTFSCYNFLACDVMGTPEYGDDPRYPTALHHLRLLLNNAARQVSSELQQQVEGQEDSCPSDQNGWQDGRLLELPITFVGFSKGCVVLNEILFELQEAKPIPELQQFLGRVKSMYWLDGGHQGGSNTWVTNEVTLRNFAELQVEVHVHVTPYQVNDTMRAWIGKEERLFVKRLKKVGLKVTETRHFEDEPRSLENHFKVLTVF